MKRVKNQPPPAKRIPADTDTPFTEALSERLTMALGYPMRTSPKSGAARLEVEIRSPGGHVTDRVSVLLTVKQSAGPGSDVHQVELYDEDLDLFVHVLEHAIREARASGTIAVLPTPAA